MHGQDTLDTSGGGRIDGWVLPTIAYLKKKKIKLGKTEFFAKTAEQLAQERKPPHWAIVVE